MWPGAREASITPWRSRIDWEQIDDPELASRHAEQLHLTSVIREALGRARQAELDEEDRRLIDELDAENEARSVRRSRSEIRRMCRQFKLCRMWTLTYAGEGCHDRTQLVRHLETFAREMKARWPEVVWLAVPELHPGGHGWHVHVAVSEFIHWRAFNAAWPHGQTESPRGPDGKRLAGKIDASVTASYLGKYVAKSLGEGRTHLGQHRYFRPKGVEVEVDELRGRILAYDDARAVAIAYFGGVPPAYEWTSDEQEDWPGPPVGYLDFWKRAPRRKRDGPVST